MSPKAPEPGARPPGGGAVPAVLAPLLLLVGLAANPPARPPSAATAEARDRAEAIPPPAIDAVRPRPTAPTPTPTPTPTMERMPAYRLSPHRSEDDDPLVPVSLEAAIRQSLANVETVQANVAVQTATVARFEALKAFIPLVNLPQLAVAFNQLAGPGSIIILPDVTGGVPLEGVPRLQQAALNRANLYFPIAPSGHITALPIAEEGIHAKVMMEQLVRRSQLMLAIQNYYEAKQIEYGVRTARLGVKLTEETLALTRRKLLQKQVHDVELTEAKVNDLKAKVLLADLEKESRVAQRELALVMHQSRLLLPQQQRPIPIRVHSSYTFDLDDPDAVDLSWMPDFPRSRSEAIQLAKQQRVDVRLRVVGLRIARLHQQRNVLGLFGEGRLPAELGFKNTNPRRNGGITLGAIFGSTYGLPVIDVDLWSGIREARLDVVASQLELESALIDVATDAGNSWDRWQQAIREWELSEEELRLNQELLDRMERLYQQKQAIWIDVLGARVNLVQADANRWTQWYNLQLARFDVLRSTEQLLDYIERGHIARIDAWQKPPEEKIRGRWSPWLSRRESTRTPMIPNGEDHAKP